MHHTADKKKPSDLTFLGRWIGRLIIYHNPKFPVPPRVVFVTGASIRGTLKGDILNESYLFVGSYRYCVEYTPRLFKKLSLNYKYRGAVKNLESIKKSLVKPGKRPCKT